MEEAKAFIAKYGNAIHIDDSDDESTDGNKATDEETAFLKSIDKEEAEQSNSDWRIPVEQKDSETKTFNGNKIICDNIECFCFHGWITSS